MSRIFLKLLFVLFLVALLCFFHPIWLLISLFCPLWFFLSPWCCWKLLLTSFPGFFLFWYHKNKCATKLEPLHINFTIILLWANQNKQCFGSFPLPCDGGNLVWSEIFLCLMSREFWLPAQNTQLLNTEVFPLRVTWKAQMGYNYLTQTASVLLGKCVLQTCLLLLTIKCHWNPVRISKPSVSMFWFTVWSQNTNPRKSLEASAGDEITACSAHVLN